MKLNPNMMVMAGAVAAVIAGYLAWTYWDYIDCWINPKLAKCMTKIGPRPPPKGIGPIGGIGIEP